MGTRTSHTPGTFSWLDLATTDAAAAKSFYAGLFGWETDDDDAVYTMCRLGGAAVCGIYEMSEDVRAEGVPPRWTSYVTVADADGAALRAQQLGGGAVDEPLDVPGAGRTAVLEDPQGAVFAVWQPRGRIGAERVNDVGCLCMNELVTTDTEAARPFYESLFGWTTEVVDTGGEGSSIVLAHNGGTLNATFSVEEDAPHWRPYFTVESVETALARVRALGGKEMLEPLETFDGSIAIALDPQGAEFALFAGEVDP